MWKAAEQSLNQTPGMGRKNLWGWGAQSLINSVTPPALIQTHKTNLSMAKNPKMTPFCAEENNSIPLTQQQGA